MKRLTARLIERKTEEWVLVADGREGEWHVMHMTGREELEKVWEAFQVARQEKARLDRKACKKPFDPLEATA